MSRGTVAVGLSGGVDSSVTAYLLKEQGWDVIGVTMQNWDNSCAENDQGRGNSMKNLLADAKQVAEYLGISHYVLDTRDAFRKHVMEYFVNEYLHARTPNPCVICNRYVKWGEILKFADSLGADCFATGHYARIEQLENGRYAVRNSMTAAKDQTYALYNLSQEQLARTVMPMGGYTKDEVRRIAARAGIPVAEKKDSQEICFIPDNDYASFVRRSSSRDIPEGNFIDGAGNILGRHRGIIHYTVGQRKGLNLSMGRPVFVTEIRPETNEVVIGEAEDVFSTVLKADHLNFMAVADIREPYSCTAKIRYAHKGAPCIIERTGEDELTCTFEEPVRAVTPGQALVFYAGEYVAGGGLIR